MSEQIYSLIGDAMRKIGAIKKDRKNQQQGFMFRGIDAVYNALNPVMSELGLFIIPEVLEQTREERQTRNGNVLIYSILKVRFTMYAPDGSSVSGIVTGEGMDSGDKASNKAMSIALKYFAFETFMIPTEETAVDPDAEVHVVTSAAKKPAVPKQVNQEQIDAPADVTTADKLPAADDVPPVLKYLANERETLRKVREIGKAENNALWKTQIKALTEAGMIPNKPLADFTQDEAAHMVAAMYANFDPTGTVLTNVG